MIYRITVVTLLLLNLLATLVLGLSEGRKDDVSLYSERLPKELDAVYIDGLSKEFVSAFNVQDFDKIFMMFASEARHRLGKQGVQDEMKKLSRAFPRIASPEYSRHEYLSSKNGTKFFSLYYLVDFDGKSTLANRGQLKLTVSVNTRVRGLYGVRVISN